PRHRNPLGHGRGGATAGSASGPAFSPRPRREMAPPRRGTGTEKGARTGRGQGAEQGAGEAGTARRDPRVRCSSRHRLGAVMELMAPFVRAVVQGQPGAAAAEADLLWNFEMALRENVTFHGQAWDAVEDDFQLQSDANLKILEDQFDELIVETAAKRKQWPKKILMHAIQAMKAEQKMLKQYQPVVTPEEIRSPPSQDAYIAHLKQVTEMASKQISGAMKSLPELIERAEGFSQALTWQPTLELYKLQQEVFAGCKAKEEKNVQNSAPPGEVTPTDADTSKTPYILLKRKAADSPGRRRYPLRGRKIALST
ncbi:NSL1 protein, partial [Neodrepanis coruscans]|nr:NSL1 protein [Neodrepanis coruscans]